MGKIEAYSCSLNKTFIWGFLCLGFVLFFYGFFFFAYYKTKVFCIDPPVKMEKVAYLSPAADFLIYEKQFNPNFTASSISEVCLHTGTVTCFLF